MGVVDVMVGSGIEVVVAVSVLPANCGVDVVNQLVYRVAGVTRQEPHMQI